MAFTPANRACVCLPRSSIFPSCLTLLCRHTVVLEAKDLSQEQRNDSPCQKDQERREQPPSEKDQHWWEGSPGQRDCERREQPSGEKDWQQWEGSPGQKRKDMVQIYATGAT